MWSYYPTQALYYATRVFGTRQFSNDVAELRQGVQDCETANEQFKFFLSNEWVFDNANSLKMDQFLAQSSGADQAQFHINVKAIDWRNVAMNHAYGVKRYVLKEEAALPSAGFNDTLVPIKKFRAIDFLSSNKRVNWNMTVRSNDEMKRYVLETEWVKKEMADIV